MEIKELKPKKALNKAFLKIKPIRIEIDCFKTNLIQLLDGSNDTESEEFHKNLVSDFLKNTYYNRTTDGEKYFINTKGRNDLVVHNGPKASSSVGVIIEAKKPTNKAEMVGRDKINVKAFQELVLYYLRERITHKNLEIKHLVVTNTHEWFIFDAILFDRLFAQNKNLVQQFDDFENRRLADTKTDFFYKQIAEPFIANIKTPIEFTYFNLQDYQQPLRSTNPADDKALIALFKLLSPVHLLKQPFANDSNSLDRRFYNELLHIIGLSETKEGGKKLIDRNKEGDRHSGTILEDAIIQLDSLEKIDRLDKPSLFGNTHQERLFSVALELSITWINRILFLKLLEAQLIKYHKRDTAYSFLNTHTLKNYADLNSLFFQVLARQHNDRNDDVKAAFERVPYLNSSLFEPTEIEQVTLFVSNLKDDKAIPIIASTVLKDQQGKKRTGKLATLQYLFEFLNAYDFAGEGSEEIQEDNKTLINASVLGLIFEKINGYKDGSFFTPGFITMYMCRETIRKAVVQKFNCLNHDLQDSKINRIDKYKNIEDIYEAVGKDFDRKKANEVINSIKICDPAVGSGHFLVSALNEMIAIKNDLKILEDKNGKSLNRYEIAVINDELAITNEDGELFEYNPTSKESQRVQETLFHEKQTIIENCLFGVDINPNSVKICRLRLWIELLKNAYYQIYDVGDMVYDIKKQSPKIHHTSNIIQQLQTLPNIDINIKCGNSLVSRFAIDADLSQALRKSKFSIDSYKAAVDTYRNARNKAQKREMERLILEIKQSFATEIRLSNPIKKRLDKLAAELYHRFTGTFLFEPKVEYKTSDPILSKKQQNEREKLENEINELSNKVADIKANRIYENAFEWRFEFPEVLNDNGDFMGFDVVIGNPPYGVNFSDIEKKYLIDFDKDVPDFEIYVYFISLSRKLSTQNGHTSFIFPNTFLSTKFGKKYRDKLFSEVQVYQVVDLSNNNTFEEASVRTCIFSFCNNVSTYESDFIRLHDNSFVLKETFNKEYLLKETENLLGLFHQNKVEIIVINKLRKHKELKEYFEVSQGLIPYDKYRGHDEFTIKNRIWHSNTKQDETYKKELKGADVNRYSLNWNGNLWISYGKWLAAPRDEKIFKNDRILVREITSDKLSCTFANEEYYNTPSLINIINEKEILDLKYCLAILNSNLIGWLHNKVSPKANKGLFPKILINDIRIIPIPDVTKELQQLFVYKVNEILSLKKANPQADTTVLEAQIDQLVYNIYDLTTDEIAIIES
jgi:adenine-specific DNA-methyltransferase